MIRIENTDVYGFEAAIRGMRNPMNSWERSDSHWCNQEECPMSDYEHEPAIECNNGAYGYCIGENDYKLMKSLVKAGSDHSKFMRMINVIVDVTAPLYWWKEFDTYKVGTVRNSCSTMHKIADKEFALDDFSHEHLLSEDDCVRCGDVITKNTLLMVIIALNFYRGKYLETNDKRYWWQMIQLLPSSYNLLPSSYNQRATIQLNYAVLRNIYQSRKNHKLDEWRDFCKWIETLPYMKELLEPLGE